MNAVLLAALSVIMFGLGLTLTLADFTRILRHPRVALIVLGCQLLLLPVVCFLLVTLLGLGPALAVGMMLLAASPGGTSANLYSHVAGGDVALNVTLTAVNTLLAPITLPIVVNLSVAHFMGTSQQVGLGFAELAQVLAVVLVPVAAGMLIRHRRPRFAERMARPVKLLSVAFLVLTVLATAYRERNQLTGYLADVGLATLAFSVISLTIGYSVPRLLNVEHRQSIASAMEIGVHNSALAITIALSPDLLDNAEMAVPAGIYAFVVFATAMLFGRLVNHRRARATTGTA